jgi:hypothetical protein
MSQGISVQQLVGMVFRILSGVGKFVGDRLSPKAVLARRTEESCLLCDLDCPIYRHFLCGILAMQSILDSIVDKMI